MWDNINSDRRNDFDHEFYVPPTLDALPQITPHFFVPPLENKPQNPVMENLNLENMNMNMPPRIYHPPQLPRELIALTLDVTHVKGDETSSASVEELWRNAATRQLGVKNGLLSWDRLRQSHSSKASSTPFLSEQGEFVYASAWNHIRPRFFNILEKTIHLTQHELFLSLKSIVLGVSSQYHVWDSISEYFVPVGTIHNARRGVLLIDGKDEVVSNSLVVRFLRIGTLLRRLEILLSSLQARSSKDGPTIHSLAHALSTILDYLREMITQCPPTEEQIATKDENFPLLSTLAHYESYESLLDALADLFGRQYGISPESYIVLDLSPVSLVSHLYRHLNSHFERQSPSIICATVAFLLTITSQEYFRGLAGSVGFGGQLPEKELGPKSKESGLNNFELDDEEDEEDILDRLDRIEASFPAFFPQKVLQTFPAAQKSLVLLKIAQPDHPLITKPAHYSPLRWLWTIPEVTAAWDDSPVPPNSVTAVQTGPSSSSPSHISYKAELSDFRVFDLEPGETIAVPSLQIRNNSATSLGTFIKDFPQALPAIIPTLPDLTSLIFKNLMSHSESLSSALLSLVIDAPGLLNFHSHLVILRSFLLITHPSFRSRLLNALFSDAGEYEVNYTAHSMSVQSVRQRQRQGKAPKESDQPWAVGLSPNLLEREMWPPVGADLSFFLRTVIVDSLETDGEKEFGTDKREPVIEEAGWRLGFAVRDLPTGPGRDKWLDPLCMALDFLYMDYKPPHPLEILISPDVLSKYQRMFTFILRLLRVESATKSLFRMSSHRAIADFLFPTLTQSRKLLLYFRFVSQAFVSSLSGYVFDTAIGGNFDPFLAQLSTKPANASTRDPSERKFEFNDVFELSQRHSALLDDILTACLLRSGQRGVGDLLRHSLELILEFTIVVGELHRGRIQEFQAAPLIEELFRKFCTKMKTLTKVLKGLVEKNSLSSAISLLMHTDGRRPTGGLEALYHLLIRIDLTDWWSQERKSSRGP
ncbi:gamma-tubulin complex, DGRIP91/SPC98 component protein [Gymnopilus junonius]|uniref:Spindle pole body component n=1 Tax=Gymnopilus junonius TaxID=109634 RepID=A0A9P5TMG3_GYMJU|nr:gamma-tubulin complex, DGRIP91/SPC98 component protein [Gymnopilus junonius]